MKVIVATFGKPKDITEPNFDGKVYRFPVKLIDKKDINTPRESSKTKSLRICAEVSAGRAQTWGLTESDLLKVLFEIVKERLGDVLSSGEWEGGDLKVRIDFETHPGPCPFDLSLIPEPEGAEVEIEVHLRIGFK